MPPLASSISSDTRHNLYVVLGLLEEELGYSVVAQAIRSQGKRKVLTPSLWQLTTTHGLNHLFKALNASMLDRRVDSNGSLFVLDPRSGKAKWHLGQPLSDLITAHWAFQNNIFVSFSLGNPSQNQKPFFYSLTQLGIWAPLSKTTWYLSTIHSSKHVFQSLLSLLNTGDQLCVFDNHGQLALWYNGTYLNEVPGLIDSSHEETH